MPGPIKYHVLVDEYYKIISARDIHAKLFGVERKTGRLKDECRR